MNKIVSGADPGFLVGGGANPPRGGANTQICQIFPKNCMKLRKFWSVGGGARQGHPRLDPPLSIVNCVCVDDWITNHY